MEMNKEACNIELGRYLKNYSEMIFQNWYNRKLEQSQISVVNGIALLFRVGRVSR